MESGKVCLYPQYIKIFNPGFIHKDISDGDALNKYVKNRAIEAGVEFVIAKSTEQRSNILFKCARGIGMVEKQTQVPDKSQRQARSKRPKEEDERCLSMFAVMRVAIATNRLPPVDKDYTESPSGVAVFRYQVKQHGKSIFSMRHNHEPMAFPKCGPMPIELEERVISNFRHGMEIRNIQNVVFQETSTFVTDSRIRYLAGRRDEDEFLQSAAEQQDMTQSSKDLGILIGILDRHDAVYVMYTRLH